MMPSWLALVIVGIFVVFVVAFLVLYFSLPSRRSFSLHRKHALVTGGSKGIGKQIALSLVSRGCHVSIIARNEADLKAACEELQTVADQRAEQQEVRWYSLDVSKSYDEIESVIRQAESELGPVDVLINNAGGSVSGAFDEIPVEEFERQMKTNYLSAVYATRCVIAAMKLRRSGHITFMSSVAGQCGVYGYTAYAPTKFALRGLADSLHMELSPYNVNVSILFPSNTETEGYKVEIADMPKELRLICESTAVFTPEEVAEAHVKTIEAGYYSTSIGLDGWVLNTLTAGASPEVSILNALAQIMLAGLFRGIMLIYLAYYNGIVKKCYRRKKFKDEENGGD